MPSPGGGEWRRRPPTREEAPHPPSPVVFPKGALFPGPPPPPTAPFPARLACLLLCTVNSPGGAPASSSVCGGSRASLWTVSPHPWGRRAGRWGWVVGGPEPLVPGPGGRFQGLRGVLPPESGPSRDGWDRGSRRTWKRGAGPAGRRPGWADMGYSASPNCPAGNRPLAKEAWLFWALEGKRDASGFP